MKKYFLLLFFSLVLFACGDETLTPGTGGNSTANNNSPAIFTISQTLSADGKNLILTWTAAKDPDGDAVVYDITLDGKVITAALTNTTFTVTGIDLAKSLTGKITAKDNKGGIRDVTFTTISSTNKPPATFIVTPELQSDNKTVLLKWTPAVDPEGDAVNYEVILDGKTLVANLTQTSYSIVSLDYNVSKEGKVIARDAKGASVEVAFKAVTKDKAATGTTGEFVSIPDKAFEQALIDLRIDSDGTINGKILASDALKVKKMDINGFNKVNRIEDLQGIEAFSNLEELVCYNNAIKKMNLSRNINLKLLHCSDNPSLKTLDISKNTKLITLQCSFCELTTLDVSNNLELQQLRFDLNEITKIDVSKNTKLTSLICYFNKLSVLDISKNLSLEQLKCTSNVSNLTICVADVEKAKVNSDWEKDETATYKKCN